MGGLAVHAPFPGATDNDRPHDVDTLAVLQDVFLGTGSVQNDQLGFFPDLFHG
jgi:hypothetical protein